MTDIRSVFSKKDQCVWQSY